MNRTAPGGDTPGIPDSASRYEVEGRATRYRDRNPARARREALLCRRLLARAALPEKARLLDAPCGAGRHLDLLGTRGGVLGLDASPSMLAEARERVPGIPLLRGDLFRLPFGDRSLDMVLCFRVLHHYPIERQADLCRELSRVAARYVLVTAFHPFSAHHLTRRFRATFLGKPSSRFATPPRFLSAWFRREGWNLTARTREGPLRDLYACLYERFASPP